MGEPWTLATEVMRTIALPDGIYGASFWTVNRIPDAGVEHHHVPLPERVFDYFRQRIIIVQRPGVTSDNGCSFAKLDSGIIQRRLCPSSHQDPGAAANQRSCHRPAHTG